MGQMVHGETTSHIIGAAFEVHNTLGYGFLEKVYQRAMQVELIKRGSQAELEVPIKVFYKSALVGEYYADLLVGAYDPSAWLLWIKFIQSGITIVSAQSAKSAVRLFL